MQRPSEELVGGSDLDDPAEVHHRDPVGDVADDCEVVGDEDICQVELRFSSTRRFSTCDWIETSSAETGSSATTSFGRSTSARARPMRCRWPPLNWCGIAAGRLRRHADALEHLVHDAVAALPCPDPVNRQSLRDQVADLHSRVERADRVLEDDLHVPAHLLHRRRAEAEELDPVERDLARRRLDQAQERAAKGRLAAAGLADEAERLAAANLEVDSVDRLEVAGRTLEDALLDREVLLQASDTEEDVIAVPGRLGPRLGDHPLVAHVGTSTPWTARRPFSHSQHATSCSSTSSKGGSSVWQRSNA